MKKIFPLVAGAVVLLLLSSKAAGQIILSVSGNRGIRNKNPGNIRISSADWVGKVPLSQNTDKVFEQFTEMKWGARALLKNLIAKLTVHGLRTIPEIIGDEVWGWAPAKDGNDPVRYAGYISERTGIGLNQIISTNYPDPICMMASAMCEVENGKSEAAAAGLTPQFFKSAWALI